MAEPVRMAMVGCGGMARHHIRTILKQTDSTVIAAVCEPSEQALVETEAVFAEAGVATPPNEPDLEALLKTVELDAVFIATPHVSHFSLTKMCLEAGVDVLLEKPMVMNATEAEALIEVRDRTGRLLVVAFNGSLSPQIREAVRILKSGEAGRIRGINAAIWQGWGPATHGSWRQDLAVSGGGFMFDTGAHMLNTVSDLAGEGFAEVSAWLDTNGRPVETLAAAIARLDSGAMVTLHGCGETIKTCKSDIRVFCERAIIHTGAWGEFLEIQRDGETEFSPVDVSASSGAWEQFLAVRAGAIDNPSPPEVGLRMARLYDAIRASAADGGRPVEVGG